jgi:hypothetical protein
MVRVRCRNDGQAQPQLHHVQQEFFAGRAGAYVRHHAALGQQPRERLLLRAIGPLDQGHALQVVPGKAFAKRSGCDSGTSIT